MITKYINWLSKQLYDIRYEKSISIDSKNASVQRIARHTLKYPSVNDVYRAFLNLISRPLLILLQHLFSPIKSFFKRAHYNQILENVLIDDNYKRLAAIPKLTEYPNKKTLDILISLLDDKKNNIRLASIETLWELHNKDAIKPLMIAHQKETVGFNRIMISLCLLSLGETSTFNNLFDDIAENSVSNKNWDMTDLVYLGLLGKLKEEAIPYLENGLRHPDRHVRWISLRVIYELAHNKLEILGKYMFLNEDPYLELRKLYRELLHSSKKEGEVKTY